MRHIDPNTSAKLIIDNVFGYLDDLVETARETLSVVGVMSGCAAIIARLAVTRDDDGEYPYLAVVHPIITSMLNEIENETN